MTKTIVLPFLFAILATATTASLQHHGAFSSLPIGFQLPTPSLAIRTKPHQKTFFRTGIFGHQLSVQENDSLELCDGRENQETLILQTRRSILSKTASSILGFATTDAAAVIFPSSSANAAETIGKDPSCNDASCLGIWDGLLADCPHDISKQNKLLGGGAGCVSSQDDTPGIFAEPWDYSDSIPLTSLSSSGNDSSDSFTDREMDKLILAIQTVCRQYDDNVEVVFQSGRYLRVLFTDGSSGEKSTGEFYFTPSDTTVQFRLGSTAPNSSIGRSLSNMERGERIRKSLGYLKVPVLRNRKRTWIFVESDDWDGFGPGSAALGPPEEMSPGEVGGSDTGRDNAKRTRRLSDEVDPRLKIDWVQTFPYGGSR